MPVGNKFAESQGLSYVPNDAYLQEGFKGSTPLDFSNISSSGIMSQYPYIYPPVNQGGGDGPIDPGPTDYGYNSIADNPNATPVDQPQTNFEYDIEEGTIDDEDDKKGTSLGIVDALRAMGAFTFGGPLNAGYSLKRSVDRNKQKEMDKLNAEIAASDAKYGISDARLTAGGASQETMDSYENSDGSYSGASTEDYGGGEKNGGFIDGTNRRPFNSGGRAGYFFGGRVNYKVGGRTDAESQYGADSVGFYDSSQNKSGRQQSYGGDSNNLVTGVDINKEINKKLTSMIPDRVDKNQLLSDNAKKYQTLSKNRNSPFFMNRSSGPKTINKNLYTNNLTDLNLQYPDIKIEDEYGMIDGGKAKSLIDQAVLEQTISPVEGLNLTRSIDTTGTQSNTSGDYTTGNFNFSSPNIEGGVLNSKANYNLGDLNLNANLNTNDSTINDSRLSFNYGDGALTGSTFRDKDYGYTTNKLGVDKTFNVGNNFNIGVDGNYENTIYNGENYRDSEFTPSLNYNDGTFNANLSKEIVEGGTQPNLGIGFQKNGFYANANNLLSQDPTGTIGYQKNIGSPDGPLQFSAGGEMDPFTGQKTAGLYGKYTFKNGGLASIL